MKISQYKSIIVFLFVSIFSGAQEQKMSDLETSSFRKTVNAASEKIKSLTTEFIQYKHMDFLAKDVEASGKMLFRQPNLLLWQYKKPYSYTIVFKNNKILINDEGRKSATDIGNSKIFAKLNRLIINSVSGKMFDDSEFTITCFKSKEANLARFVPKDAALKKYIRQIELTFDKAESTVTKVRLIESAEDYTVIAFKNKIINAKVDDSDFTD